MESYKTVTETYVSEITEKRSRFIATLAHAADENTAMQTINKIKSENREARHNVYAYVINNNSLTRYSDDGEPHSTAGKPVLDVINGKGLRDVVLVVTRYFGGILLGTGGLVRAYSAAAQRVTDSAEFCVMCRCTEIETECAYSDYEKLLRVFEKFNCHIFPCEFTHNVKMRLYIQTAESETLTETLDTEFFGKITLKFGKELFFPLKIQNFKSN